MINQLAKEIHEGNKKRGFYEGEKNIGEMLALIHSEVSEALEADRKGRYAKLDAYRACEVTDDMNETDMHNYKLTCFKDLIKDTFEDELADIVIRVFDLAAYKGIDIEAHIALKLYFNSSRPYKHGKNY